MSTPSYKAEKYTAPTGGKRAVDKTFDFWSSTTMPNVSISGGGCAYCSVYQPVSISGWTAGDPVSLGSSIYNESNCISIMSVENVSINDGRPSSALEMIAKLRAFSINSCGEIEKIGPQEEKYWDLDCAPCSLGYDDFYNSTQQVSLGDARCVRFHPVVDVSLGMDYDCPSTLKVFYKTRAVELNACGEIDSISPVSIYERSIDLEDKSFHSGSVTIVTDTKTELDDDGGVSSSLSCSTDEHYGNNGGSHSHDFTLDVTTTTYTQTSYQKTRTYVFECGRLLSVSAESGWSSTNTETWTTQSIGCSGGGGGNPPPEQCDCDPGVQTIYLDLIEPDGMDPVNGMPIYTQIELNWQGHPNCTYVSADGTVTITFDPNANGMIGAWILSLTPSQSAGLWSEDIECGFLIGSTFYDSDDPNGITEAAISS
ncbi:MAG: hypothetical protein CL532_01690 [Aestuariivita sp.]|nr:hypothetical protein [Aestuariivita sp.]|tara:strand:+ start:1126 stop:2403 length:1278 start_codon:yes stop_codon:yes gene_type:complete